MPEAGPRKMRNRRLNILMEPRLHRQIRDWQLDEGTRFPEETKSMAATARKLIEIGLDTEDKRRQRLQEQRELRQKIKPS